MFALQQDSIYPYINKNKNLPKKERKRERKRKDIQLPGNFPQVAMFQSRRNLVSEHLVKWKGRWIVITESSCSSDKAWRFFLPFLLLKTRRVSLARYFRANFHLKRAWTSGYRGTNGREPSSSSSKFDSKVNKTPYYHSIREKGSND